MSKGRNFVLFAFVLLLFTAIGTPAAQGVWVRLSDYASDGVNPPTADQLDASLNFSVEDSTLTLAVTNLTPETPEDPLLKINEIYFNTATDDITGLTLTGVTGSLMSAWQFGFKEDDYQVNGFGLYDVGLIDGEGTDENVIGPGEVVTFSFDISGTGPFYATDFTTELSTQVDDHIITLAAAKFYNGPPEMSAYGATDVPEPATILLLGLGGLALLRRRRN